MKTDHANAGLLNILFMPGASGTFVANMLSKAVTDPWWTDYVPEPPNKVYKVTQEYMNPYNQIAMTFHPPNVREDSKFFDMKNVNWINIINTEAELEFVDIMSAVKRQDYDNNDSKQDILDRLYAKSNPFYGRMAAWQGKAADLLRENNNVLDVKWSDIFVKGDSDVILSMMNLLFKGQYTSYDTIDNIAKMCVKKHKADLHLYNELRFNPDIVIDNIFKVIDEVYQESLK